MADIEGLYYADPPGLLVCKIHSTGIHPDEEAIKRHLRGKGHFCKGRALREAVATLSQLYLRSRQELLDQHPPILAQPIRAIPHLKIQNGWCCSFCDGRELTTSRVLRDRHAARVHEVKASAHSSERPFWRACELQTFFSMTADVRYFRVLTSTTEGLMETPPVPCSPINQVGSADDEETRRRASQFLERLQAQRQEHELIAATAANRNPDPTAEASGEELWMKKLGISRYIAGLHKDEMVVSYRVPEAEDDVALSDLRQVSGQMLRETWRWCQHGTSQRMTDPQAARISSFWHAADPESKNNAFRRTVQPDTLDTYFRHWMQLLTFVWNGWRGRLFPQSLAALRAQREPNDDTSGAFVVPWSARSGGLTRRGDIEEVSDEVLSQSVDESSESEAESSHAPDMVSENPYIHYSKRLQGCIERFAHLSAACDRSSGEVEGRKYELLKSSVAAITMALIQQHLAGSPFDSPMLAYAAMLAVDTKSCAWEEPGSFNHYLSALIYCGQLWVFRLCCDTVDARERRGYESEEDDDGLDEELDRQMRLYFSNTVSKPLSYLLLWRRRLFAIAPVTMVNRPATWDLARETVTYQGICVSMEDIRRLLQHTLKSARDSLFERLMFGIDYLPRLKPAHLQENDHERRMGWWFGKHAENKSLLNGSEDVLVEHVASTPELRRLYLEEQMDATGAPRLFWRQSGMRYYRQCAQEFLRDMTALIHFGAGPPVRAPEFLSPMWRNTERTRHIQLRYGKVLIHLVEHKMMAVTGKNVNNVRFLPDDLGELLVNYLVYPIAVLQSMAWQEDITLSISPYLWANADGSKWPAKRFAGILKAACRRAGVPEVGTAVWRQMSSAIINTHFDQSDRACFAVAQDAELASEDIDEEGADCLAATLVSMSNHSLRTHRQAYANISPFANVWDGKLVKSHRASEAWADFFGLSGAENSRMNIHESCVPRKRSLSGTAGEYEVARKILNVGQERHKRHWTGAALLEQARRLYASPHLQWRCSEQEQAMRLVANQTPEVLLVLATGSGKSLPFMLGSCLPGAKTTVVVVPLVLLRLDLLRRCAAFGLDPTVWRNGQDVAAGMDGSPTLLFVSVEVAAKHPFRQYARRLYDTGNLDRFMIDECHLVQTSAHYRKNMTQLSELRQYRVPFIYMTATLPLRLEKGLFQRHHIGAASVVRGCTKRPNIRYGVEYLQAPKGEKFLSFACQQIVSKWEAGRRSHWHGARVMVFVRSCANAEEAAEYMGCSYYHRDIGTTDEKEARLKDWISGDSGSPFLTCTTAAGAGVDYPHVRWVVHIEDPYGLIDFTQESGRAGRDGETAGSSVYMKRDPRLSAPPTPLDHPDPIDHQGINEYLRGIDCRRLVLARELDESRYWTMCGPADIECDICESRRRRGVTAEELTDDSNEYGSPIGSNADINEEDSEGGGLIRLRRQQMYEQQEIDQYLHHLEQVKGGCMICRILTRQVQWTHPLTSCSQLHKWRYIRCKQAVSRGTASRQWIKSYTACFRCAQPQSICGGWSAKERAQKECEYRDLIMPAVWALWEEDGEERAWLVSQLEVQVKSAEEALIAAARVAHFGGVECVLGVKVLAKLLRTWSG